MRPTHFVSQPVLLNAPEVQKVVKVEGGEFSFPEDFMAEFAPTFHDSSKHLVVASASEQDFACVKLEERTSNGPYINTKIVRHAENCSIRQY